MKHLKTKAIKPSSRAQGKDAPTPERVREDLASLESHLNEIQAAVTLLFSRSGAASDSGHRPVAELAAAIRQARKAQGLSQRTLAELADVSQSTVVGLENNTRTPQLEKVLQVLNALGLTLYVGPKR